MGKNFGMAASLLKSLSSRAEEFDDAPPLAALPVVGPALTTVMCGW